MQPLQLCSSITDAPHLEDGLKEVRIIHDLAVVCILVVHLHALTLHQTSQHYYHNVQCTKFENADLNSEDNNLTLLIIIENTRKSKV
jgi:hypothetical protein